jgi:predicted NAD/FAD-dependent oxidoreductase
VTKIGIVGAGAAAAAATYVLEQTAPDADVTVLEKSGGVCGRAATRRHDGLTYDYGANYLKAEDQGVVELLTEQLPTEGLVEITEPIHTFDESGSVAPGREATEEKWTYRSGLTQIAKRLFERTDATVQRRTRIETIVREETPRQERDDAAGDGSWTLHDTDGEQWGPFDVILLNPPAPQTETLLANADWGSPARTALQEAVADVPYRTIWSAVLHYEFPLDVPYYGLVNTDREHDIGWVSREECKAGHVPDDETLLIVQASPDWSVDHYDDPPAENVAALAEKTAALIGDDRLGDPVWTDHQGWRYALPDEAIAQEPLADAEAEGVYCVGDWVVGEARLHAALANGLDVGERLGSEL